MSLWNDMKTAPMDGTDVLVCIEDGWDGAPYYTQGDSSTAYYEAVDSEWVCSSQGEILEFKPTHWMPIPELPKSKDLQDVE